MCDSEGFCDAELDSVDLTAQATALDEHSHIIVFLLAHQCERISDFSQHRLVAIEILSSRLVIDGDLALAWHDANAC